MKNHLNWIALSRYTQREGNVYAIVLNWPKDDLKLGAIDASKVTTIQMLGLNGNLNFTPNQGGGTSVKLLVPDPNSGLQWAWVLKINLKE